MDAPDDEFAGFESAELMHARGLATKEAERICARYLERGTWKRAPHEWTMLAERSTRRVDATRNKLGWFEAWVDAVGGEAVGRPHDEVLRDAIGWALFDGSVSPEGRRRVASKLVHWLCAKAGPGAAGCCAHVLDRVYLETRKPSSSDAARLFADEFTPLARRLIEVGVAELRSSAHHGLMVHIVGALERSGPPELLVAAFEIVIAAGHEQSVWWNLDQPDELWWLTEAALAAGLSPTRCWDIVTRTELQNVRRVWAPLLFIDFPHCAKALMRGLASGGIPSDTARVGWPALVLMREPSELEQPLTQAAVLLLADVLHQHVMPWVDDHLVKRYLEAEDEVNRQRIARWVVFVADGILRMAGAAGALESRRVVARYLKPLVGWSSNFEDVAPNRRIAESLREWIEADQPASDDRSLLLAAKILHDNPTPTTAVAAALECLSNVQAGVATPAGDTWLVSLRVEFERFVCLPWNEPIFGIHVKALLAGVTRVVFHDDLSELVTLSDTTINLQPDYYRLVFQRKGTSDESMALCMLYFVHELLHVPQGISEGATVQRLRAVGAELTLMHLDLTADHAAILLVNHAVPRWSIAWLKRLVSDSLESFPASSFHTHAARFRKSLRMISARVDSFARDRSAQNLEGLGYLFIDFAPAGGDLFLFAYGPPMRVLARVALSAEEAKLLNEAAEPASEGSKSFAKIGAVLERALAAWSA
ncbi:hypothetical protein ACNOYE_04985 [Nannocystaceae bacterium ST9]